MSGKSFPLWRKSLLWGILWKYLNMVKFPPPAKDKRCFGFGLSMYVCIYVCMYVRTHVLLFFNMRSCCGSWSCASLQIGLLRVSNSKAANTLPPIIHQRFRVLYWLLLCISRSQLCLSIYSCLCRYVIRMGVTVFKLYVSKLSLEFHVGHIFMGHWPFVCPLLTVCSIIVRILVVFIFLI